MRAHRNFAIRLAAAASLSLMGASAQAADPERGKALSAPCAACHGETGISVAPIFPNLAGQYEQYLYRALLDYKLGNRKNPIMSPQVEALSRADMRDLAAFYARQQGLYLKR